VWRTSAMAAGQTEKDLLDVAGAAAAPGRVDPDALHPGQLRRQPGRAYGRARGAVRGGTAWRGSPTAAKRTSASQRDALAGGTRQRERCTHVWPAPQAHDAQPPCGDVPHAAAIAREGLRRSGVALPVMGGDTASGATVSLAFPGPAGGGAACPSDQPA